MINNININIIPKNYKLLFDIDTNNLRYIGNVIIDINILNDVDSIILNSKSININNIFLNNNEIMFTIDKIKEIIIINNDNIIKKGLHILEINFDNIINTNLEGLYYSNFDNNLIITTHLEPIYARTWFPCFDVPDLKATFELSVKHSKNYNCISNMPIKNIKTIDNYSIVDFNITPIMSTYLLCMVLGDIYPVLEKPLQTKNGTLINGYSFKKYKKNMIFSIENTLKSIEFFEKLFKIPFILPKLDIIPIPNFEHGAMENWGLITFREELILNFNKSNDINKYYIISTINHEIAHQWFGNLVTLKNWNDLWLNESSATYFAWIADKELIPEYQSDILFYNSHYKTALLNDSFPHIHPIIMNINNNENISEIFDEISYSKGACLINYIASLLGEKLFNESICEYLNKYKFKNTESHDLYNIFNSKNIDKSFNIKELINNLLITSNYPILNIIKNDNDIIIKTNKFSFNKLEKYNITFPIKINAIDINNNIINKNININNNFIKLTDYKDIFFNTSNKFLCIVNYNFFPNLKLMNNNDIINYLYSNFLLLCYGINDFNKYIKIVNYLLDNLNKEINVFIIIQILDNFIKILEIILLSKINNDNIKENILEIFNNKIYIFIKNILNKESKVYYQHMLLEKIFEFECIYYKNKDFINSVYNIYKKEYEKFKKNGDFVQLKCIFNIIIIYFDDEFDNIKNIALKSNDIFIKNYALMSLAYTTNENRFDDLLNNYSKYIKLQDTIKFFVYLTTNILYQNKVIDYIINNFNEFDKHKKKLFVNVIIRIIPHIYNYENLDKIKNFVKKNNINNFNLSKDKINDILNFTKLSMDNILYSYVQ